MGIQSKLKAVPSIGLGVNAISPLDLATAYATLASGGIAHQPTILSKVVFPDGHTETASQPSGHRVIDAKVAAVVTKILEANVQGGDGHRGGALRPAGGGQDRDHRQLRRRVVRRLGAAARDRRLGRAAEERAADRDSARGPDRDGRDVPGRDLAHVHDAWRWRDSRSGRFADPGSPPYQRWCGRYQFALTWRNARPSDKCTTKPDKKHSTQTKNPRARRQTRTTEAPQAAQTTQAAQETAEAAASAAPTTTTDTTTTEPTTTTTTGHDPAAKGGGQ